MEMAYPVHPGEHLREEVLPARGITVEALVSATRITRTQIDFMLACKQPVTAQYAVRIEAASGYPAKLLVAMQGAYDLADARRRHEQYERPIERIGTPVTAIHS